MRLIADEKAPMLPTAEILGWRRFGPIVRREATVEVVMSR